MKLNYSFGIVVILVTALFNSHSFTQAQTSSENQGKVNKQTTYYFGLHTTAVPISYRDENENWKGYCYALIKALEEKNKDIKIEPVTIDTQKTRFQGRASNGQNLDAECGP